ncbi:MAG: methyltransferase domain-containing protein [Pseudonocardiaceae bacterium]
MRSQPVVGFHVASVHSIELLSPTWHRVCADTVKIGQAARCSVDRSCATASSPISPLVGVSCRTLDVAPEDLRAIFDQDTELYDRTRPSYPTELVDGLAELAGIEPGARVAEIGPGTGQVTAALTARGARVVGVELGPELAAVLRRELADASLEVVVSAFEDSPLPLTSPSTRSPPLPPGTGSTPISVRRRPRPRCARAGRSPRSRPSMSREAPRRSSLTRRPATNGGTPRRLQACGCLPSTRFLPPSMRSTPHSYSSPPSDGATSRTSPTPRAATSTCFAPTPATGRWPRTAGSPFSPALPS